VTDPVSERAAAPVIRVDRVSRWFGNVVAVSDVSFDVTPGITGLLGPNGAGKTTLLRMITGLAATSTGTIRVFGEPARDNPPLYRRIGVMSEHETVYDFMKGRDFVRMMAKLRGVTSLESAVDRAIELVDLADAAHRPMGTYSRGMRQRMRLAATLVHDPELLILDEPLNGADPRQRVHFQEQTELVREKLHEHEQGKHHRARHNEGLRSLRDLRRRAEQQRRANHHRHEEGRSPGHLHFRCAEH
jgi:ABC-2 type transport system ATP-binding protein